MKKNFRQIREFKKKYQYFFDIDNFSKAAGIRDRLLDHEAESGFLMQVPEPECLKEKVQMHPPLPKLVKKVVLPVEFSEYKETGIGPRSNSTDHA